MGFKLRSWNSDRRWSGFRKGAFYVAVFLALAAIDGGLKEVISVAGGMVLSGLVLLAVLLIIRYGRSERLVKLAVGIGPVFAYFALLGGMSAIGRGIQTPPEQLIRSAIVALGKAAGPVATILLILIGYCLFILKTRRLLLYSYAEIAFAVFSCQLAVERMRQEVTVANLSVVAAAVYLVVRGLDNRKKAVDEGAARLHSLRSNAVSV